MSTHRILLAAAGLLVLAGCGGSGGKEAAVFDAAARAETATSTKETPASSRGSGASDAAPATEDDIAAARDRYEDFLAAENRFLLDDLSVEAELTALASQAVIAEVAEGREQQWAVERDLDVEIIGRTAISNVTTVSGSAEELLLHDCLEVDQTNDWLDTADRRVGLSGAGLTDQIVTMTKTGAEWIVADIDVRHSGAFGSVGLGCVPARHIAHLETSIEEVLVMMASTYRSPSEGVPPELAALGFDGLVELVSRVSDELVERGWYIDGEEIHTIEVTGSSPRHGNRTFLVEVCTQYPDGYRPRLVSSGEIADPSQGRPPGSEQLTEFYLSSLPDGQGGFEDRVVDVGDVRDGCD